MDVHADKPLGMAPQELLVLDETQVIEFGPMTGIVPVADGQPIAG